MELNSTENAHNNKYNTKKKKRSKLEIKEKYPKDYLIVSLFYVSFGYGNGFINFEIFCWRQRKKVVYRRGMTIWWTVTHERIVLLPNTCPVISYFRFRFLKKISSNRYGPFSLLNVLSCIIILWWHFTNWNFRPWDIFFQRPWNVRNCNFNSCFILFFLVEM